MYLAALVKTKQPHFSLRGSFIDFNCRCFALKALVDWTIVLRKTAHIDHTLTSRTHVGKPF